MRVFSVPEAGVELDGCLQCRVLWFDPDEFEKLPKGVGAMDPYAAQMRMAEIIAKARLDAQKRQSGWDGEAPAETWKYLLGLLGFPVEYDAPQLRRRPWATWLLAGTIFLVSVISFYTGLRDWIELFGFYPNRPLRLGGLTPITSFFLHGGWFHLLSNLYFLLVFGDNVEDYLGRGRFLLLLLVSTVVGDFVHLLLDPRGEIPCIGASGGISGVLLFYTLLFPHAKLSMTIRYWFMWRWITIPASMAFGLWILLQLVSLFFQLTGYGSVAATAHLGGVLGGLLFWAYEKWERKQQSGPFPHTPAIP